MQSYFITHPRFRDVFIEAIRVVYRDEKRVKVKIRWWNRSHDGRNPFPISNVETMEFSPEKWNEFVSYNLID